MKTCWQILEIESTTQIDIIRQAYLARLPLCHPETDPQGFKALRQAYEEALRLAVNPVEEADDEEKDAAAEHEILRAFRTLLDSESDRFQPSAWQKFIQQLNTWNMEDVDQLRWPLCAIAIEARYLSLNCASLLAERLNWHSFNDSEGMDEEEIIERGLGIMRKECYLLHNVDILSNCDFESLMYYHQNSSNINATLLVSPRKTSRYLLFNDDNLLCGWVNKDTMETKPAGFRYREGEYQEYAYSGIQVTTPKILHLLPKGKYSIIDFYLSICHRVDIQCYVEDDLQLLDIGKPENLKKAEEFLSKL